MPAVVGNTCSMLSRTSNLVSVALTVGMVSIALLVGAAGCGGDDGDDGAAPDCSGDVPTYGELTILEICTGCHSSELSGDDRMEAPADVNFDTYEAAVDASLLAIGVLSNGTMPPPEADQPSEAQRQDFYDWAGCDTPQ